MAEENGTRNGMRKFFPGIRIVEGLIIAVGAGMVFALAGNFILVPKLEVKMDSEMKSICASLDDLKQTLRKVGDEIVFLRLKDQQHDGDIELLRYHTGLRGRSKKIEP